MTRHSGIAGDTADTSDISSGSPVRPRGVLVVDDDVGMLAFLGVGLRASGFAVWLATDGCEGVDVYRENGSAIDLLLLDVRMPGWDGPEALSAIRDIAPDVPCCFMSGDLGHYTEAELLDLGAVTVLQKPFRLAELVAHVGAGAELIDPDGVT